MLCPEDNLFFSFFTWIIGMHQDNEDLLAVGKTKKENQCS